MAAVRPLRALLVPLLCTLAVAALAPGLAGAAPGAFRGFAPLGDYERTALREGSAFLVSLPTRAGEVAVAFAPAGVAAASYSAELASVRGPRRGARRPAVTTFSGRVAPDSGQRDFAKLAALPGGRVSGLLRVEGVLYDLAADSARGDFLLGVREITPDELAGVLASCGVAAPPVRLEARARASGAAQAGAAEAQATAAAGALLEIELATEADAPFVAQAGGADLANARILAVVNAINGIYEADLGLTNRVVFQRAWSGSDPYTTSDSNTLLSQFRSRFSADVAGGYDDAQLFSGRDFEANVIGRAWIAATCTSYRFGVNQGLGLSDATLRLLVAHEAGHNHGANHDTSGIMTALLDPSVTWFSEHSRGEIGSFLGTTSCLAPAPAGAAPALEPIGPQGVTEGERLELALAASDPDGQVLSYGAAPLLPGASLDASGHFTYEPPFDTAGCGGTRTLWVELSASDPDGNRASESVPIGVSDHPTGAAPVLADPADRSVRVGDAVRIQLTASDADGDALAFSAAPLPAGATLSATGLFAWTPTSAQVGTFRIAFTASDCTGRSAAQQVSIGVRSRSGKKR